jgi:inositol-hexakisphosphate kinase
MSCLARDTICKPLNDREHRIYKSLPKTLKHFTPRYEGTMKVEAKEDDHGYITLTGQPPAKFSSVSQSIQKQLHRQGSQSLTGSSGNSRDEEDPVVNDILDAMISPAVANNLNNEEVFCNPWALKCHRNHLKKLGLLSPGLSTPPNLVNGKSQIVYLLLENLVSKYKFPCVLDLKVGSRQYADDVSAAKKARKIQKAAETTSATLGLRLTGMQVT